MKSHILVTGASGFIGKAFCKLATQRGLLIRAAIRSTSVSPVADEIVNVGQITDTTDWSELLSGVNVIVHLAARAHVIRDLASDPLAEFRSVNVDPTLNLALQASRKGVSKFIYISSIGVNGLESPVGKPFCEKDSVNPQNAYTVSKWEAEQGLLKISLETGLNVVIIRPPLVYGNNAPGNFGSLVNILNYKYLLPLGAIHNKRSFISLENLVDFIIICVTHPMASNQIFLISDGEDLSTTDLVSRMARISGRRLILLPVPKKIIQIVATLIGRADIAQRLCGNLQIDITKARHLLGWNPALSVDEGLKQVYKVCL